MKVTILCHQDDYFRREYPASCAAATVKEEGTLNCGWQR